MKITEVAPGVFAAEGKTVNWALIADGDALTLVDAGWPGYLDDVLASISEIGHKLSDVEAVLVTHAHIDHIGSLPRLLEKHRVPVLLSPTEAGTHVASTSNRPARPTSSRTCGGRGCCRGPST